MNKNERKELLDLCVEIYASNELDYEITLGGNGTNASEAANVATAILNILRVKRSSVEFKKLIAAKVKELRKMYGDDEDETGDEDNQEAEEIKKPSAPVIKEEKLTAKKAKIKTETPEYREESEDDYPA